MAPLGMPEDILELWTILAAAQRAEAKTSVEVSERLMQESVISVIEGHLHLVANMPDKRASEYQIKDLQHRLNRLFAYSGLTRSEWNELMPMEAQFKET